MAHTTDVPNERQRKLIADSGETVRSWNATRSGPIRTIGLHGATYRRED